MSPRLRLWSVIGSGAVSVLANSLGIVCITWTVLRMADGAAAVGLLAAIALAVLCLSSFLGGWIVDRYGARRTALWGCALSAVPIAVLACAITMEIATLPLIFVLVALAQGPDGGTVAAFESRLPELADAAGIRLERVNATDDVVDGLAGVAAAPLAGLLIVSWGVAPTLWLAFGLGLAAALAGTAVLPHGKTGEAHSSVWGGLRHIVAHGSLLRLLLIAAILVAVFQGLEDVILPVLIERAGQDATALGFVLGAAGAGGLVGASIFAVMAGRPAARFVLPSGLASITVALVLIAVLRDYEALIGAAALAGLGAGAAAPFVTTSIQRAAPAHMRGRVLGAAGAAAYGLAPLTALLAGYVIDGVGPAAVLGGFAIATASLLILTMRASEP